MSARAAGTPRPACTRTVRWRSPKPAATTTSWPVRWRRARWSIFSFGRGVGTGTWSCVRSRWRIPRPSCRCRNGRARSPGFSISTRVTTPRRARALTAAWTRAADQGDEGDLAFILIWLSWLETRSGELRRPRRRSPPQAETVAALDRERVDAGTGDCPASLRRARYQGDVAGARAAAAEAIAVGEHVDYFLPRLWAGATLALVELSVGNAEARVAGVRADDGSRRDDRHRRADHPLLLTGRDRGADRARTARPGRTVDRFVGATRPRARSSVGARHRRTLPRAAAGRERRSRRSRRTRWPTALTEHERLDMPFERARTVLAKGLVERRAKQRAKARASLTEAFETFERVGRATLGRASTG